MKMLPIAIVGLIASVLFQCESEAQFRSSRFGLSINIPLGGYGYVGPSYRYGGYGYGGHWHDHVDSFGPHVGIPVYPVPAYRAPIYAPSLQTFSLRIQPRLPYLAPQHDYVYPQPYVEPRSDYDAGQVYGNYQSARPIAPTDLRLFSQTETGGVAVDENSLLQSASQLRQSLARRSDDSDIWLDYLKPDLIIDTVKSGADPSPLIELLKNYDGLSGNADLSDIWVEPGFRRTHQGLRNYVEGVSNRASVEIETSSMVAPVAEPEASQTPISEGGIETVDEQDSETENLPAPI